MGGRVLQINSLGDGDSSHQCGVARDLDRLRSGLREIARREQLTVFEANVAQGVSFLCKSCSRPCPFEVVDNRIAPNTGTVIVLELKVWIQSRNLRF